MLNIYQHFYNMRRTNALYPPSKFKKKTKTPNKQANKQTKRLLYFITKSKLN